MWGGPGPALLFLLVYCVESGGLPIGGPQKHHITESTTVYANIGSNISLHCSNPEKHPFQWNYPNGEDETSPSSIPAAARIHPSATGALFIFLVSQSDSRAYTCQDMETNESLNVVHLTVRSPPPAVTNLTVFAHSVYALVTWEIHGDGGYPIKRWVIVRYQNIFNNYNQ